MFICKAIFERSLTEGGKSGQRNETLVERKKEETQSPGPQPPKKRDPPSHPSAHDKNTDSDLRKAIFETIDRKNTKHKRREEDHARQRERVLPPFANNLADDKKLM